MTYVSALATKHVAFVMAGLCASLALSSLASAATASLKLSPPSQPSLEASVTSLLTDRVPLEGVEVSLPDESPSGQARALLWAADTRPMPSTVHIVSPGALIPASSMATFARTLAATRSSLVLVVDYDWPVFRESPAEQAKAFTFARAFSPKADVEIFGHSAGGAILAPVTDAPPANVRRLVLFGVSRLFVSPTAPRVPVRLISGARDGLVSDEGLVELGRLFDAAPERLPEVNHFCIVDGEAGSPESRAQDGATTLDAKACADKVVEAWFGRLKKTL
jgi:hypothetical protein